MPSTKSTEAKTEAKPELKTEIAPGQSGQPGKTFLFHIGTPKTGTTSIQNALMLLSDDLKARGVTVPYDRKIYPNGFGKGGVVKGGPHTGGLAYFFGAQNRARDMNLDWAQEVSAFLADTQANTFVFSHENMSQQGHKLRADLLVPLAAQANIRFLAYLRAPLSYLNSYCQQAIEGAGPGLPGRRQDIGCVTRYLKGGYAGLLVPFEQYGQVDARNFDRLRLGGRVVPDFFAALGVDDLGPQIDALENRNVSKLRFSQLGVFMALKSDGIPPREEWLAMRAIISSISEDLEPPMTTSFLPASLGATIAARWEEDREVLYQRYGVSFDAPTDFKPGPEVLSFSAEYAAALQEAAAPMLSGDQQEWLTKALAFADMDLEDVLPGSAQKIGRKAGQKAGPKKRSEEKPVRGDVTMSEATSKKPKGAPKNTVALARALYRAQNKKGGAKASSGADSGKSSFKDVREEFMPLARRMQKLLHKQGYSLTKS